MAGIQMRGNPSNLRRAAAAKSAAAQARAEDGLAQMRRRGDPITFRGLAQAAGVSLDLLYRTSEIRSRVEQLRATQRAPATMLSPAPDPDQPSSVIRTLTAQLTELKRRHHDEISTLRQALDDLIAQLVILIFHHLRAHPLLLLLPRGHRASCLLPRVVTGGLPGDPGQQAHASRSLTSALTAAESDPQGQVPASGCKTGSDPTNLPASQAARHHPTPPAGPHGTPNAAPQTG
jgi:hypothetical protein